MAINWHRKLASFIFAIMALSLPSAGNAACRIELYFTFRENADLWELLFDESHIEKMRTEAERGDKNSVSMLSSYYFGRGRIADAKDFLIPLAAQGNVEAFKSLALLYEHLESDRNHSHAADLLWRLAASKGSAAAKYELAVSKVAESKVEAEVLLIQVLRSGDATYVIRTWGLIEEHALESVRPVAVNALRNLQREGNAYAAWLLYQYKIESRLNQQAINSLNIAARGRYPFAQYKLAHYYFDGSIIPQNFTLAYAWANLAAPRSDEARQLRDKIAERLDQAAIIEGQKLSTGLVKPC